MGTRTPILIAGLVALAACGRSPLAPTMSNVTASPLVTPPRIRLADVVATPRSEGPITLSVGQTLALIQPDDRPDWTAHSDARALLTLGRDFDLAVVPIRRYWLWRAMVVGQTSILINDGDVVTSLLVLITPPPT